MTPRPHPILRGGRARRPRFALLVMMVLLLAASALFSAAAPHHHGDGPASASCVDLLHSDEVAHEHQHGNDWTPRLSQRARAVTVTAVPYPRCDVALPTPASMVPGVVLSRLGVLRV
jgi:hypothetical protein